MCNVFHRNGSFERRARGYWLSFAVGLFLVVVIDLFTTMVVTARYGTTVESNPLMRWLLVQGPTVLIVAHLAVVLLVVYLFSRVIEAVRRASTPTDGYLETAVQAWLGLLLVVGAFVATNNVAAIILGRSIL